MCDVGYLMSQHVVSIMQMLTVELHSKYNMQMLTTKCLNTAVMFMYLMVGSDSDSTATTGNSSSATTGNSSSTTKGNDRWYDHTHFCDVSTIRNRVKENKKLKDNDGRTGAEELFRKALEARPAYPRTLYYIMLTDGDLPKATTTNSNSSRNTSRNTSRNSNSNNTTWKKVYNAYNESLPLGRAPVTRAPPKGVQSGGDDGTKYFPGHVFVVERLAPEVGQRLPRFSLYQSYIGHYDLAEHAGAGAIPVGYARMKNLLAGLVNMTVQTTWDKTTTRFWKDLTNVDEKHASQFEGYVMPGRIHFCYKEVVPKSCTSGLCSFVKVSLGILSKLKNENNGDGGLVYGAHGGTKSVPNAISHSNGALPMTVDQLIDDFMVLQQKLSCFDKDDVHAHAL